MTTFRSICCSLGSVVEGIEQKAEGREVEGRRHSPQATSESMDDMKQVLRCPECEARVALERDLISINELSDSVSVGQFEGVANVRREGDFASCARCGNRLFALELVEDDSQLVLEYDGKSVFKKSPLRILTITKMRLSFFYNASKVEFVGEMIPGVRRDYIQTFTFNEDKVGCKVVKEILSLKEIEEQNGTEVDQKNVFWLQSGTKNHNSRCKKFIEEDLLSVFPQLSTDLLTWYEKYDFDTFQTEVFSGATYDFVLVAQLVSNGPISWSGIRSRDMEEILVSSWVATGGNVLLGQWGLPWNTESSGSVDEEELRNLLEFLRSEEDWSTNRQDIFARLIEEGHYLAYWKPRDGLPEYAQGRIKRALAFPIHSTWKFRNDLHEGAIDMRTGTFFPREGRANEIFDQFLPKLHKLEEATANNIEGEDNSSSEFDFILLVRKSSRGLLDVGSKIYSAFEDRWSKVLHSISTT